MIKLLTVQISSAILVLFSLTLTTVRAWDTSENTDSVPFQLANSSNGCPLWQSKNEATGKCACYNTLGGLIRCTPNFTSIFLGQIMTFDRNNNRIVVMSSPYDTYQKSLQDRVRVKINVNSRSELNKYTCGHLNRSAEIHCGKCTPGNGPSVFTLDMSCYNCSGPYHGWALYLTFEILPSTVFFLIIISLQIKPTSGILNSYVLFSQILVSQFTFGNQLPFEYYMGKTSQVLVNLLQTCYGFWNLDFFRHVIPPFCVSSSLNNLDVLLLQLISVFYPMILIFVGWLCCVFHEKEFRLVVWIWKPFKRYLSHFSVTNNPKQAIMNVFTTFIVLSYSKLVFISANLLNSVPVFIENGTVVNRRLFFDPNIQAYSSDHARYVIVSFFMFSTFIAIPPLVLLLYQIPLFHKYILKRMWCREMGIAKAIQMFADAFQCRFKDGTNSTLDCRFFAGAYLIFRIALSLPLTVINNRIAQWAVSAIVLFIGTGFIVVFHPYKKRIFTWLDATMTGLFAIGAIFCAILTGASVGHKFEAFMVVVVFGIASSPLIYMIAYILYKCAKTLRVLKPLVHWRRRGYQEISDYRYDSDYEWDSSSDQDRHYLEVGTTDSFQSE